MTKNHIQKNHFKRKRNYNQMPSEYKKILNIILTKYQIKEKRYLNLK